MSNRLAHEDSPYLQQHKDNPVDWYPWCDEAFTRAASEHKAIFISIGYSSCHWCHVMEHEVFENETIAEFLNAHFISIKVDREERPDIDKHYQEVHALLNRRAGGWPTSIFCTPQNKPFFAGTYLPPYTRDKMMGFDDLIRVIAKKVGEKDVKLFENADEIAHYLKPEERQAQAAPLQHSIAETFIRQCEQSFEHEHGGFSQPPKFPHTSTLSALLSLYLLDGSDTARQMLTQTLDTMHRGGIYDLVDGGFCRYSVDAAWLVPHFEKMTYDNGLLCELYARAGRTLGDEAYLRTAREIATFMLSTMCEDDLFYSASDADSEGHEGTYFVFGYETAKAAIIRAGFAPEQSDEILAALHITPQGNFEGNTIVWLSAPAERPAWFEAVRDALATVRAQREYPFIDRKVQTSWNAMMIRGLFELGRSDPSYGERAVAVLDRLIQTLYVDEQLYHSALIHGTPKIGAFLEDYAWLGTALVQAYEHTFNERYLLLAQLLANRALEHLYARGRWYFSRGEFTTDADPADASYPGAVGVMVDLLMSLGTLVDPKYHRFAATTLEYYSKKLVRTPFYFPYLFEQTLRHLREDRVIKAEPERLKTLMPLPYPFIRYKADAVEGFMVCGQQSCFARTEAPETVPTLVQNSLP